MYSILCIATYITDSGHSQDKRANVRFFIDIIPIARYGAIHENIGLR